MTPALIDIKYPKENLGWISYDRSGIKHRSLSLSQGKDCPFHFTREAQGKMPTSSIYQSFTSFKSWEKFQETEGGKGKVNQHQVPPKHEETCDGD